jgi:HTH-type transcriptional regulator, competence development regulator
MVILFVIIIMKGCVTMAFSEYIKKLREDRKISQRELAEAAGISGAAISRIEAGERKKPSASTLKAIAPCLGVSYQELLKQAGYLEEIIDHEGYTEKIYRDENGKLIDITRSAKQMYDKDSQWANLAFRVTSAGLSEAEINQIKTSTKALLELFLKDKKK